MHKSSDAIVDAVSVLGDTTLVIAMEECSELIKEASKFYRSKGSYENIAEEIADVLICIDWLKEYLDISDESISNWRDKKESRIISRIESNTLL